MKTDWRTRSGTVGRYLMAQAGNVVLGRFADLIRMYKAPPAHALTEEFYETDPAPRLRARIRHSDRRPSADCVRQADDGSQRAPGVGACGAS